MPTQKKLNQVEALEEKLRRCTIAIATEFRGMNVAAMADLRRRMRERGVEYLVVKNTLAGIASDNAGVPGLRQILEGPTGLAFGYGDIIDPAKALAEHIQATRVTLVIHGAITDGQVLRGAEVQRLAAIPPKPVLMSQMLGNMLAPLYGLAYALTYHIAGLARVLDARRSQMEEASKPPVEEASEPAAEQTAEQALEQASEPAAAQASEPAVEEASEPTADEASEPTAEQASEPTAEQASEPTADEASEPTAEQASEPAAEQACEPPVEQAGEPPVEQAGEPPVEQAGEPASEESGESPVEEPGKPAEQG